MNIVKRGTLAALSLLTLGTLVAPANAQLYGIAANTESLYTIDPLTGNATLVAGINGGNADVNFTGLEYLNGTLYAGSLGVGGGNFDLYSINTTNGNTTFAANISNNIYGLGGDPTTGLLYGFDFNTRSFLSIDTQNGFAQNVISNTTGLDRVDGIAFRNGLVWGVDTLTDDLYTINPSSGVVTTIGDTELQLGFFSGLAFVGDTLYLTSGGFFSTSLYTLNTTNGVATLVGNIADSNGNLSITGLAFAPSAVNAPEPGSLALGVGLLAFGVVRRRKK